MNKTFRKTISILLFCLLIILLSSCNDGNFQIVDIEYYGQIKVPDSWTYSTVDGFLYFRDGTEDVMVQKNSNYKENNYFSDISDIEYENGITFSTGAAMGTAKIEFIDGSKKNLQSISIPDDERTIYDAEFIFLDSEMDEDLVKKIVKSYEPYMSDE